MRIYVETNFILELILEQAQLDDAERLIELARAGSVELVLPALSLLEAYGTVHRRDAERRDLLRRMENELLQVGRSRFMKEESARVREVLATATNWNSAQFQSVRARVLEHCRLLPLDAATHDAAGALESEHDLSVPDALIFACILRDLEASPAIALFVTTNFKDFNVPSVTAALASAQCELVTKFSSACARAEALPPR